MKQLIKTSSLLLLALAIFFALDITSTGPSIQKFLEENGAGKEMKQILYFPISLSFSFFFFLISLFLYTKKRLKHEESMLGATMPIAGYFMFCGMLQAYLKISTVTSFWLFITGLVIFVVGGSVFERKIKEKKILSLHQAGTFSGICIMVSFVVFLGIFLLLK